MAKRDGGTVEECTFLSGTSRYPGAIAGCPGEVLSASGVVGIMQTITWNHVEFGFGYVEFEILERWLIRYANWPSKDM